VAVPELLDRLLRAPGPSGTEDAVAAIVRAESRFLGATVETDVIGSTTVVVGEGGPLLALVAHADQIGMAVVAAHHDGLLSIIGLANTDPRAAAGQRVVVLGRDGPVPGVVALRSDGPGKPSFVDLYLDIGADDADEALDLVEAGDPIVLDAPPLALAGGRVAAGALDNRASLFVGLEVLRRLAASPAPGRVALVASVQEEVASVGASRVPLRALAPDLALALDVTYATDAPGADEHETGAHPLGSGPAIFRGGVMHPGLTARLRETAEAEGIPFTVEVGARSLTDADDFFSECAGIPSGLVSVPIRRMHTPIETVQLSDLDGTILLLEAFARRLEPDVDWSR